MHSTSSACSFAAPSRYIVALTGGIGSGKSVVADLFKSLQVTVIDTDVISHDLTKPGGAAIAPIQATLGAEYIHHDGSLNRPLMRSRIFSDAQAKQQLEGILHPLIRAECERQSLQAQSPYVIVVVPLLFESQHWSSQVQRVLVVDCSEQDQIARVTQRNGLSVEQVRLIMNHQMQREQRIQRAHDVILNTGGISDLYEPIKRLHRHYLALAKTAAPVTAD